MKVACVDVPALPLQLVWRRQPTWRAHPVVVVTEDRPQGVVLWACDRARAARVLPGQRYAHALSLCAGLFARVVPDAEIAAAVEELRAALHAQSPAVEAAAGADAVRPSRRSSSTPVQLGAAAMAGTFWLDGDGLARIYEKGDRATTSLHWGNAIATTVASRGLTAAVVVGFSRFATCAVAKAIRNRVVVFATDADERAATARVPLARLDLDPKLRDSLDRLGVRTMGELVRLPGGGVLERFGASAHALYQLAVGERWDPLVPEPPPEAPDERVLLDDEERDVTRLLFGIKGAVDRLLARLAARARAVTALHLELTLRHAVGKTCPRADCIVPAAPTLDARALVRLCHLRLEGRPPEAGVVAIRVWADDVVASREQLALFAQKPRRDLRAADEAIARVRAELGDDAVVKAVLREGHLPEARFAWERLAHARVPEPRPPSVRPLVRRVHAKPLLLPAQMTNLRDDGWLLSGLETGSVVRLDGPYLVSGGWWATEIQREYHFAETRRGDCHWLYFDRARRRWYLHGEVE
jgi:protein ImuB